jgi:hypothetical protein
MNTFTHHRLTALVVAGLAASLAPVAATAAPPSTEPPTPPIAAEELTRIDDDTLVRGNFTDGVGATLRLTYEGLDEVSIDLDTLSHIAVARPVPVAHPPRAGDRQRHPRRTRLRPRRRLRPAALPGRHRLHRPRPRHRAHRIQPRQRRNRVHRHVHRSHRRRATVNHRRHHHTSRQLRPADHHSPPRFPQRRQQLMDAHGPNRSRRRNPSPASADVTPDPPCRNASGGTTPSAAQAVECPASAVYYSSVTVLGA